MALSDCPKCWDTPCTCGHEGYSIVYHTKENSLKIKEQIVNEVKNLIWNLENKNADKVIFSHKKLKELVKKL
jgi:hypothetical protein